MYWLALYLALHFSNPNFFSGPEPALHEEMIAKVNAVRKKGCYCGRRYMAPVQPVKWNENLYQSAMNHAMDMDKNQFFAHFSSDGLNIGDRIERVGYDWQVVGENIGEGQQDFDEVLRDWLKSYSHCVMLMNPKVDDMAVARYSKYWVQHFGKKMRR